MLPSLMPIRGLARIRNYALQRISLWRRSWALFSVLRCTGLTSIWFAEARGWVSAHIVFGVVGADSYLKMEGTTHRGSDTNVGSAGT